ncbi:MAG: hypothetical protein GQ573_02970 [Gammaproteobacteria bacterium]|nr:hypothetical protein [Gammaproteobacteria bacterium]
MRRCRLWSAIVALLLLFTATHSFAMKEATTTAVIDLQLTGETVNRWRTRPSFPESITFAYYHVYMAGALEQEITPKIRQKIVEYIVSCQQPDGGFRPVPAHAKTASVIYTYYALKTLDMLKQTKAINSKAAINFLLARVQKGGGFAATAREGERANLATTYYGIEALHLLGAVNSLDKTQTLSFIRSYREPGRGFSRVQGSVSIPKASFMGIRSLKNLDALTDKISSEVVAYLKTTRYSGQIKDQKYRLLPKIEAMAYTLEGLATLSAVQQVDEDKVHEFIRSLYIPDNGGFGPKPGLGTTPPSTYYAIVSLVQLGRLPDPIAEKRSSAPVISP